MIIINLLFSLTFWTICLFPLGYNFKPLLLGFLTPLSFTDVNIPLNPPKLTASSLYLKILLFIIPLCLPELLTSEEYSKRLINKVALLSILIWTQQQLSLPQFTLSSPKLSQNSAELTRSYTQTTSPHFSHQYSIHSFTWATLLSPSLSCLPLIWNLTSRQGRTTPVTSASHETLLLPLPPKEPPASRLWVSAWVWTPWRSQRHIAHTAAPSCVCPSHAHCSW